MLNNAPARFRAMPIAWADTAKRPDKLFAPAARTAIEEPDWGEHGPRTATEKSRRR
jgi:hypothetical protein